MSKKRILSDGHSSYWKDDKPKSLVEKLIPLQKVHNETMFRIENAIAKQKEHMFYTGKQGLEEFNKLLKEEFDKTWKQ